MKHAIMINKIVDFFRVTVIANNNSITGAKIFLSLY